MKAILFLTLNLSLGCMCFTLTNIVQNPWAAIKDEIISDEDDLQCLNLNKIGLGWVGEWLGRAARSLFQDTNLDMRYFVNSRATGRHDITRANNNVQLLEEDSLGKDLTVIIVHGFLNDGQVDWMKDMEDALLQWGDVRTIAVDWSDGAKTPNYLKAVSNVETAGKHIANMITQVVSNSTAKNGVSVLGKIHCVGHSLGSHVCAVAAHELKKMHNKDQRYLVQRITGLDPAKPCFGRATDLSLKLDKDDAPFVDVIHSNTRSLGKSNPLGHVDFYPNAGKMQPGCNDAISKLLASDSLPMLITPADYCSHMRACELFIDSLNNCDYVGRECSFSAEKNLCMATSRGESNVVKMGMEAEKYAESLRKLPFNSFVLGTSDEAPFCRNSRT